MRYVAIFVAVALAALVIADDFRMKHNTRFDEWLDRRKEKKKWATAPQKSWIISAPETSYTALGKLRAVSRAAVGNWVDDSIGAYIGAATTPQNEWTTVTTITFRVLYKHGGEGEETVDITGDRCRELLAVLDEAQADELLTRFGSSSLPF